MSTIIRSFARYIALPVVSAGVIDGAALGLAGAANAATVSSNTPEPRPGIVTTPYSVTAPVERFDGRRMHRSHVQEDARHGRRCKRSSVRDLARLSRRLQEIAKEIEAVDLRASQEAAGAVTETSWDEGLV